MINVATNKTGLQITIAASFIILILVLCIESQVACDAYARHRGSVFSPLPNGNVELLAWAVSLLPGNRDSIADDVANSLHLENCGQIGQLKNHYLFVHPSFVANSHPISLVLNISSFYVLRESIRNSLETHALVWRSHQQISRKHVKRSLQIQDPMFGEQWHLVNHVDPLFDINITGVWESGITGNGVTICVVDDGLEWSNPDLQANYNPNGSWDLNSDDEDPSPEGNDTKNSHGTRCAGEIAAARNNVCGVGVAFDAKISGLRALDGTITDSLEATAFNKYMDVNDIYSCSWGPDDNGKMVEGPQYLALKAMELGVNEGRNGYGSVYVVASGNGGVNSDNCNFDGYANSVNTLTIGAVTEEGLVPYYAEECPAMLAVTFSSGLRHKWDIVTTDWTKTDSGGCTKHHTGTSAAAPLAAGIVALMLQARPCLFWRDVHYLMLLTAVSAKETNSSLTGWYKNAVGLYHNNYYGFGRLNAWRLINAAKSWMSVPWQATFTSPSQSVMKAIPLDPNRLSLNFSVSKSSISEYGLSILEYVQVSVSLKHPFRGRLKFWLNCPSGTTTLLTDIRPKDNSTEGLKDWRFTTVRCWGEEAHGDWSLALTDTGSSGSMLGMFLSWQLLLYGTSLSSEEFIKRKKSVQDSYSGENLRKNFTAPPCSPPLRNFPRIKPISEKVLKVLFIISIFLLVCALYEIFENICCYREEKKVMARKLRRWQTRQLDDERSEQHQNECVPLVEMQVVED